MGIYLNPGSASFAEAVNSELYVDKTEMIRFLNTVVKTERKYVSVSRPRRFGKTMATRMLCAYYGIGADSRELFEGRKLTRVAGENGELSAWDRYLGAFDVMRVVMTDFIKADEDVASSLCRMQKLLVRDIRKQYPDVDYYDDSDLPQAMADLYAETHHPVVVVIDEWDAVFRVKKDDQEGQTRYLDFLRDWLKDKDYIALAYMTGILPIKKYGKHSALNMFIEYSMTAPMQMARFTGFTEEEVMELCESYGRDFTQIKEWYDGYEVSDIIPPDPAYRKEKETGEPMRARVYALYNPLSVVNAISNGHIRNYWNKTETYEALAEYIRKDYDGLKETVALLMDGGRIGIDIATYQNDMTTFHSRDDVLSLLIHLGYLGYDDKSGEVFIPNREILDEFRASTKTDEWTGTFRMLDRSQELLRATWAGDEELVATLLEEAHDHAENKTYHDEAALSYAIRLAYYAAHKYYTSIVELDSGKGYADIVYLPGPRYAEKPALLIELKYDKSVDSAIDQIKRQKYPDRLEQYKGNLLLIGINYDREVKPDDPSFKHHKCRIERA